MAPMKLEQAQAEMRDRMAGIQPKPKRVKSIIRPDQTLKFWSLVDHSGDCWLWMGTLNQAGYGKFGPIYSAHRVSFFLMYGSLPPAGFHLHHKCHVRRCVNPRHLEPVSGSEHRKLHPQPKLINPTIYAIGSLVTCTKCGHQWSCRTTKPPSCSRCFSRQWWKGKAR